MAEKEARQWVDRYVRAWNSNDRKDIEELFTNDARYYTEPHAQAWQGHDEIVEKWLERKDAPGETSFTYRVIAVEGDLAIVKGEAIYKEPRKVYSNLWEIRFASDGRVREFVEWWMEQ